MVDIVLAGLLVAMLIAVGVSQRTRGVVKPAFPLAAEDRLFAAPAEETEISVKSLSD